MGPPNSKMLTTENYSLTLKDSEGRVLPVVENVSFSLEKGKCLGIAGESGSGKSVLAMSMFGLISQTSIAKKSGKVMFNGSDIAHRCDMRGILGKKVGIIFQEPMTAMNPLMTLYQQISETVRAHTPKIEENEVRNKCFCALKSAGFSEPENFWNSYPHQLSGGMRQRAMIAMAIVMDPDLIIADEPTTAIDAELQVQIVSELKRKINEKNNAMIFISHDLGVMRVLADDIAIMYCGCLVEKGTAKSVLSQPKHPYTQALVNALPRLVKNRIMPMAIPKNMPSPDAKPKGCVFSDRCPNVSDKCLDERPKLKEIDKNHFVACELYL